MARFLLVIAFFCSVVPAFSADTYEVFKSADIAAQFAQIQKPVLLYQGGDTTLSLRKDSVGAIEASQDSDEVRFIRDGSAVVSFGDDRYELGAGDVVSIPHGTVGRIETGWLNAVVLRFRVGGRIPPSPPFGNYANSHDNVPVVAGAARIAETFSNYTANRPCDVGDCVIVHNRTDPGEAHALHTEIYFVETGTATIELGGRMQDPRKANIDRLVGDLVAGSPLYGLAPGDVVAIPENVPHRVNPLGGKFGYLEIDLFSMSDSGALTIK